MTAQRKLPEAPMTLDEFFVWDGGGHVGKLELVDGMVRAMAPASATHSIIQLNIAAAIKAHLRGSKCRVGTEAPIIPPMARRINARVPDIAVTCAPISDSPVFEDPVLIVEVLSPSNEAETWESIHALAGLVSLKEILIVQSTSVYAEVYSRAADGAWPREPTVVVGSGIIVLASMGCELSMAEVYAGTHLVG
jgi:Uma2 family endonuclease